MFSLGSSSHKRKSGSGKDGNDSHKKLKVDHEDEARQQGLESSLSAQLKKKKKQKKKK